MQGLDKKEYIELAVAAYFFEGIIKTLNSNGAANFTVCPECHIDDFTHVEGCTISKEVDGQIAIEETF
jgi:hypothetical protein